MRIPRSLWWLLSDKNKRKQVILSIRDSFEFLGLPVDSFSDSELEEGLLETGRLIHEATTYTTEEVVRSLKLIDGGKDNNI